MPVVDQTQQEYNLLSTSPISFFIFITFGWQIFEPNENYHVQVVDVRMIKSEASSPPPRFSASPPPFKFPPRRILAFLLFALCLSLVFFLKT